MNIYICEDHDGHYPVGVCSVVVAASEYEARELLKAELHEHGLDEGKPFTLRLLNTEQPKAFVIYGRISDKHPHIQDAQGRAEEGR